ncbi:hypothetical protein B0H13DRAFT_1889023 [Mycena leptocephala]|nr:hypothetical protein B0H13DRAFT_1889023 [Mycena leptocephala]
MSSKALKPSRPRGRPPKPRRKTQGIIAPGTGAAPAPLSPPPLEIPSDSPLTTGSLAIQLLPKTPPDFPALSLPDHPQAISECAFTQRGAGMEACDPNDFNVHAMHPKQDVPPESLAVVVKWIGHPGTSPRDPRARRCFIRWNDPRPPQNLINQAIERKQPVIRWDLRCAGVHDLDFSEQSADGGRGASKAEEGDEGDEEGGDANEGDEIEPNSNARARRWIECSTLVKLHRWSTAPEVSKRVPPITGLETKAVHRNTTTTPSAYGRTTPLPEWRGATPRELQSMHVVVKQRELLDRNPWRATHLLVKANKDKIYGYVPHDFSKPDSESKFAIGLTDDYSLDSGIAYSLNDGGLGSDQCWHHKSQNRAAMSLLCTVDEGEHMVPGTTFAVGVFISANATTETLLDFYCGTHDKICERAKAIVEGE